MELLDTDSDEELPSGWEERVTTDGRVYYAKYVFQCKSSIIAHPRAKFLDNASARTDTQRIA